MTLNSCHAWGIRWYGWSKQWRIHQTRSFRNCYIMLSLHLWCILLSYWSILCGVFHHHPILYIVLCGGTGGWHDGDSQPQTVSLATVSAGPTYLTYYLVPPLTTLSKKKKEIKWKTEIRKEAFELFIKISLKCHRELGQVSNKDPVSHIFAAEKISFFLRLHYTRISFRIRRFDQ